MNDTCVALCKNTGISGPLAHLKGRSRPFKPHAGGKGCPVIVVFLPEEPPEDMQRTCSDIGILGAVAGVVGTLQATEVLKEILGIGESLAGKMLFYDALSKSTRTIKLPQDPNCKVCAKGMIDGEKLTADP